MQSKARTVKQYLAQLPADRREAMEAVRAVVLKNLPKGYEEGVQYGAIGYYVPHRVYPPGYHCDPTQPLPFVGLASQKNYMALYLMCVYGDPEHEAWFREAWARSGKKLNMGKSCVRFKKLEDLPLNVIGQTIKRVPVKKLIAFYESALAQRARPRKKAATPGRTTTKVTARKKTAKKPPGKSTTRRPARKKSASKAVAKRRA